LTGHPDVSRPTLTGRTIGAYRILSLLGEGGMGEVYTARDQHLERDVAIKVLPEAFTHDQARIDRFRREAQLLAALNHPNIATIHGLEESAGALYLVMELVPGQTLEERLHSGRPPIDDTLRVCSQLAEALGAAHQRGIAHRDIKPANIKLTPDGRVKVLDFGLAKSGDDAKTSVDVDNAPTMAVTSQGMVLGTPAYMSPEQVRGESGTTRSDLWAFGCVLFELLVARRAFEAPTMAETVAAVLMTDPDWHALPPDTPNALRDLLRRCLDKDPQRRPQNAREIVGSLDRARREGPASERCGPTRTIRSLAVLPFVNSSGDPQMDYLSDGVTESIILSLSRLRQLKVTAQSSVFRYRGHTDRALEIGRTLGVEAVVTGRVLQRGSALQISVELADVEGWRIWGAQYRRKADDIFAAEEAITREISDNVRLTLSREHTEILARRHTGNVEAYHLYLKGRFHWGKRTEEALARSMRYFRQAIECDPTYALAHAGLAEAYIPQGYYCHLAPTEAFPRARAAAGRALEIDPDLSEARSVIAMIRSSYERDLDGAEREARTAVEHSPNYPRARQALAEILTVRGQFDEAIREARLGVEMDPLALYMNAALAMALHYARQFDAAIAQAQSTIDLEPFYPAYLVLGLACQETGRRSEAIAALEHASRLSHRNTLTLAALGGALAEDGRTAETAAILTELDEAARRGRYVSGVWVAAIYAALNETDQAIASLERGLRDRCCWLLRCVRLDPRLDVLRDLPRFHALLQSIS
jgi:serine/threonine protein kinase/tetratricopeptide (TPR) repeat protein